MNHLSTAIIGLIISFDLSSASERLVFVLSGQSNAVGIGCDRENLPAELNDTFPNIPIHATINGKSAPWESLRPALTAGDGWCMGSELSLGFELQKKFPGKAIAIVKYAYSAKTMYFDYHAASATQAAGPDYGNLIAEWNSAMSSKIFTEDTITPAGFFWMQGEGDCYNPYASVYGENLKAFIASVRTDLHAPNMPFVIGMIDSIGFPQIPSEINNVRNGQRDAATSLANVYTVETSDLAIHDPPSLFPYHFSVLGLVGLGQGFAAALPSGVPSPLKWNSRATPSLMYPTRLVDLLGRAKSSL
jgi:hypothetical protein